MTTEPILVTILHTNDMHSRLEAMSKLSSFARQRRRQLEAGGRKVLQFDSGDAADRSLDFTGVTKGAAFPRILSAMGCDLQSLGNAISVTYGPMAAVEMAKRADFPVLAANFFKDDVPLFDEFAATAVFQVSKDQKIGVVGLTVHAPDIYRIFGFEVQDYRQVARFWVEQLIDQGIRTIIILSHLGLNEDRLLADFVPGIDVIIGGHSHSTLPDGEWCSGVLIAQAGDYAQMLGQVDLIIDPVSGRVISKKAALIRIPDDSPLDPLVEEAIRAALEEAETIFASPIAALQAPLGLDHFHECEIVDLTADILRERLGADVAMICSGLFHQGLPSGIITLGMLNAACFTTANPQLTALRGEQILDGLERGFDPAYYERYLKSFRGSPIGIPGISGMKVEADPNQAAGRRIQQVIVNGTPLELQQVYRVAHTDAEVISDIYDGGFLSLEKGQVLKEDAPMIVREAIAEYLGKHSHVPPPVLDRWIILNP